MLVEWSTELFLARKLNSLLYCHQGIWTDSSILTADWDPAKSTPDPAQEKGVKDGPKIWEGHEWNAIKLGSQWYLIDATWTTYDDRGKVFNLGVSGKIL